MTSGEQSRRSILKAAGALAGTSVVAAGSAVAQTSVADFFVTNTDVQGTSRCGTVLPVHTTVTNYSSFADTQEIELYGSTNGAPFTVQDSQYLQLDPYESMEIELVSDTVDQTGDWDWMVHTDVDQYPGNSVDIVGPCL